LLAPFRVGQPRQRLYNSTAASTAVITLVSNTRSIVITGCHRLGAQRAQPVAIARTGASAVGCVASQTIDPHLDGDHRKDGAVAAASPNERSTADSLVSEGRSLNVVNGSFGWTLPSPSAGAAARFGEQTDHSQILNGLRLSRSR
jgi:hypothetical protein